jgi:hypothetical protein
MTKGIATLTPAKGKTMLVKNLDAVHPKDEDERVRKNLSNSCWQI